MCLIADHNTPYIAKTDIVCYKVYVLNNNKYVSPYQNCDMPGINELVTTELQKSGEPYVEEGFHSFVYLEDAEIEAEWFRNNHEVCIVKCIIPKGSKYYAGKFVEDYSYCSESIKIEEIIMFH